MLFARRIISLADVRSYTDRDTAFADGLAYVESDGVVVMKGDNTTYLQEGQNRNRRVVLVVIRVPSRECDMPALVSVSLVKSSITPVRTIVDVEQALDTIYL